MKPADIKTGQVYKGGKSGKRRRVKAISRDASYGPLHRYVTYIDLDAKLAVFGRPLTCGLIPFAKWATEEVKDGKQAEGL
jgi:hypothetical protein